MARFTRRDRRSYTMPFSSNCAAAGGNPADATTYYYPLGLVVAFLNTTAGGFKPQIIRPGTIRSIVISEVHATTNGSGGGEVVTYKYSVNGGAAVTLGTTTWDQGLNTHRPIQYDGLAIAVAEGDYVEIQVVTPTWTTNPAGCFVFGSAFVEV